MEIRPVNIGFGDIVCAGRIIAIVSPNSMSVKRIVQEAREAGRRHAATQNGRNT